MSLNALLVLIIISPIYRSTSTRRVSNPNMALRVTKKPEWVAYLISIGIPEQYAEVYAPKFVEQQTLKKFLKFIPDDKLQEIYGINLDGHRLAIRHSTDESQAPSTTPTTSTSNAGARANVRYHPPQLKPSMTPSSFRAFVEHWTVYKKLVGIPSDTLDSGGQIFTLTCADHPEIRRTIADHKSNHLELGENDYIEMLRKLLTARANPETYRNKLFYMTQNSDETCHQWLKRLKEVPPLTRLRNDNALQQQTWRFPQLRRVRSKNQIHIRYLQHEHQAGTVDKVPRSIDLRCSIQSRHTNGSNFEGPGEGFKYHC